MGSEMCIRDSTPPLATVLVASLLALVLVELKLAVDDPLAPKSQANAVAANATEATAANIILLNFFITLLKML